MAGCLLCSAAPALADRAESMRDVARADAAFAQGQPRTARVELMNATEADPKNAIAWMYQARIALTLGDGAAAEEALDRAIGAGYRVSRTLHFRAHARLLEHRPADALAIAVADQVAPEHRGYAARLRGRHALSWATMHAPKTNLRSLARSRQLIPLCGSISHASA